MHRMWLLISRIPSSCCSVLRLCIQRLKRPPSHVIAGWRWWARFSACRGDSLGTRGGCSKCTPLCRDSRDAKAHSQEIPYFKSHMWLLTIAAVYQHSWRQRLWILHPPSAATLSERVSVLEHAWMDKVELFNPGNTTVHSSPVLLPYIRRLPGLYFKR